MQFVDLPKWQGQNKINVGFRSLTNEEIKKAKQDLINKSFDNPDIEDLADNEKEYSKQDERDTKDTLKVTK